MAYLEKKESEARIRKVRDILEIRDLDIALVYVALCASILITSPTLY